MSSLAVCSAAICVVAAALATAQGPAAVHQADVRYMAPVDAEVVDPFRAPSTRYGAGNRGVDYATTPGTAVRAAAPGVVVFAGRVAGSLHVTVRHPDGIRTTYAFLASASVARGRRVAAGDEVGRAGASLHWSARAGAAYLDPLALLAAGRGWGRARLVPDDTEVTPRHRRG